MMKKIIIGAFAAMLFVSCQDKLDIDEPQFEVTVDKTNYKVGDTVRFKFTGNANNLAFYSGEPGFEFANKDRSTAEGKVMLNFTSFLQNKGQLNTLQLLATSDISTLDSSSVVNANWIDLTSRATLSSGSDNTASGSIDVSDLIDLGKPVCFAFRYTTNSGTLQPSWTIRTFNINYVLNNGFSSPVTTLGTANWARISLSNPNALWTTGSTLFISGGAATAEKNLDYVVTMPLVLNRIAPDLSVSIRDLNGNMISGYEYIYTKPGNFTATFVGTNETPDVRKKQVKEVQITVSQ